MKVQDSVFANDIESVLLTREEIEARIAEIAAMINRDYAGEELLMVGILKGAVLFYSDLFRQINLPASIDFMSISSYGASTRSSGVVRILKDLDAGIENRHVLIVEDIVDSGLSLRYICDNLTVRGPKSIKTCTLLDKPERRKVEITPDYLGFTIPNEFVVGYGLDYAEKYRNLDEICILKPCVYAE